MEVERLRSLCSPSLRGHLSPCPAGMYWVFAYVLWQHPPLGDTEYYVH